MSHTPIYIEGDYLRANPSWHVEDSKWKAQHILTMLSRHRLVPTNVGEIGCGAGEILLQLYEVLPNARFVGYDISPQAISLARTRERDRLSFRQADLLAETVYFDLVVAADVFEHVDDYLGFLRALHGKSSWTVFHIPLDLSALNLARRSYIGRAREQLGHLHHFTADTALSTLRLTGYETIDWFYTAGAIDIPHNGGLSWLLNLSRRAGRHLSPDITARMLGGFSLLVLAR